MMYQVNRFPYKRSYLTQCFRLAHNDPHSSKVVYPMGSKKLLRVAGSEASIFLQGLITNDMRHFEDGAKSMYAMFLNNKGRVLYDTLIHKCKEENSFLLECDKNIIGQLLKHLKLYKLKRKVEIGDVSDNFKLWALVAPENALPDSTFDAKSEVNVIKDPRIPSLGYRIITPASVNKSDILNSIGTDTLLKDNELGYIYLRYQLGVSEGAHDLPPGSSFPLEANCDYLHGVSFHKGCYIGQELTARVHHTGVVRKRLMPLKFKEEIVNVENDSLISDSTKPKSNLGKLKGYVNDYGLGLVRIKEAMDAKELTVGKYAVEVIKPTWWPIEAPKEKAAFNKLE